MVDSKKDTDKKQETVLKVSATTCPRCLAEFICNAADIQHCQCWGVTLVSDDFSYLKAQGFSPKETGCLCRNCLLEIQREVAASQLSSN